MRTLLRRKPVPLASALLATLSLTLPALAQDLRYYDGKELGLLLSQWGCTQCDDIDGDCDVDADDLAILISRWGRIVQYIDVLPCEPDTWMPPVDQPVPDYDFQWATITHPNNPPIPSSIDESYYVLGTGSVPYEYRMATTEVSTTQYAEFLNAFLPHIPQEYWFDIEITGLLVGAFGTPTVFTYTPMTPVYPESDNSPAGMGFWMAARYCNWLHNNKGTDLEDFEMGAYDLTWLPEFNPHERDVDVPIPFERLPGARFWIPTLGEWNKAAYWDPENTMPDRDGWWLFPYQRDEPVPNASPEQGGLSNWGLGDVFDLLFQRPDAYVPLIGSYDIDRPWGLKDISGGLSEWTTLLHHKGSSSLDESAFLGDDYIGLLAPDAGDLDDGNARVGLRVASAIPAPPDVARRHDKRRITPSK
ncbi:MAG: SUMF1/EgtB/PvdO family nonheme iron enzyme [Planctomycetota bacterium]